MKVNLKDKKCLVVDCGIFLEMAIRLAKDFGTVYYWTPWISGFPSKKSVMCGVGMEGIIRVNDWEQMEDDIDIFVFPDVYFAATQERLRKKGKFVFGSGGDDLELDRWAAKEFIKGLGLDVQPVKRIFGLSNLREHLKKVDNKWIKISKYRRDAETWHHDKYRLSEPVLDKWEKDLGPLKEDYEFIVEDSIDGEDVVECGSDPISVDGQFPENVIQGYEQKDMGYIAKVVKYSEMSPLITDFNKKIAPYLKEIKYRMFFSTEIRVGKDKKPYMIDFCNRCFSEDTEILTNSGWKLFKDLEGHELVATLNPDSKYIEYQRPTAYQKHQFDGELINITNKSKVVDLLVTEDHAMFAYDRHKRSLKRYEVKNMTDKLFIPRTGIWTGIEQDFFELPPYNKKWNFAGRTGKFICEREKDCPSVKIKMESWLKFLALYLSDGSLHSKHSVNIAQFDKMDEFEKILKELPFKYHRNNRGFLINNIQLSTHLKQFGLCDTKYIPDYIKTLTPRLINIFIDTYTIADGMKHKGQRLIFTASKRMADDFQELFFKVGSVGSILVNDVRGTKMRVGNGKEYTRKHISYKIAERDEFKDFYLEGWNNKRHPQYLKKVPYSGMVYDITVPNHIIYVRRHNKAIWSGNCGSPPNELYQNMLGNLGEVVWWASQGILIQPEYTAKFGLEVLIHSDWASQNWQAIYFPEEIREHVKLRNACKINGIYYIIPQDDEIPEIGAVVTTGNSIEECQTKMEELCKQIEGYRIDAKVGSIEEMLETAKKGEKLGIKFF